MSRQEFGLPRPVVRTRRAIASAAPISDGVSPRPQRRKSQWSVDITLRTPHGVGGSMAVELAFAMDITELLNVNVNRGAWDFRQSRQQSFHGHVTTASVAADLIGDRPFRRFRKPVYFTSAARSELFTSSTSNAVPEVTTAGSGATSYQSACATYNGFGRIAQAGQNFDVYTGSVRRTGTGEHRAAGVSPALGLWSSSRRSRS